MHTQSIENADEFIDILKELAKGNYKYVDFEKFMRIGNPEFLRAIATQMSMVTEQIKYREEYLEVAVKEMQKARVELEDFNQILDKKVHERTNALQEANVRLESISTTDSLSGINNRRNFDHLITREISRARRYGHQLSCIIFDIDNFKKINDNHGHTFGDIVIAGIGKILKDNLRDHDICARYGGDEFVVLLPETNIQAAEYVAEKFRKIIAGQTFEKDNNEMNITVSMGVSLFLSDSMPNEIDLINAADKALYNAKKAGRNQTKTNLE